MTRNRIAALVIGLFFLIVIFLSLGLGLFLITPAEKEGVEQIVIVNEGVTLRDVADELVAKHVISSRNLFLFWAKVLGYGRQIKAGEYRLSAAMPPMRVYEILTKGVIITHPVTIPEGFTKEQIAELLYQKGLVDKEAFLKLTDDSSILKRYGISSPSMDGYLYPDTYQFGRGLTAESIIDTMVKRFRQMVGPLEKRAKDIGMPMKDVVTLASIVEKETGRGEERPLIASVFLNRLKKGMRLESDPTVIYGIVDFNGNLTKKDLRRRTPYNTYVIRGLPPGPIANPGLESITAVLHPAQTEYFYFVSKNDGSHQFSKTLSEHNRAVRIYQKKRRKKR